MRAAVLRLTREIIGNNWLPGHYVLSEFITQIIGAKQQVMEGHIGSYRVEFDFRDLLQRQMWFNLYDVQEIALVKTLLKPGDVFLDAGANIGFYSLVASQLVGETGQVHAFEPIQANVDQFNTTIERNKINNIEVNQIALGAAPGFLTIYQGDDPIGNSGWASVVQTERKNRPREVAVTSLDTYLQQQNIQQVALIKLDIEGAEFAALQGCQAILSSDFRPAIILELNEFLLTPNGLTASQILRHIEAYGYRFQLIGRTLVDIDPSFQLHGVMNILCLPSW